MTSLSSQRITSVDNSRSEDMASITRTGRREGYGRREWWAVAVWKVVEAVDRFKSRLWLSDTLHHRLVGDRHILAPAILVRSLVTTDGRNRCIGQTSWVTPIGYNSWAPIIVDVKRALNVCSIVHSVSYEWLCEQQKGSTSMWFVYNLCLLCLS